MRNACVFFAIFLLSAIGFGQNVRTVDGFPNPLATSAANFLSGDPVGILSEAPLSNIILVPRVTFRHADITMEVGKSNHAETLAFLKTLFRRAHVRMVPITIVQGTYADAYVMDFSKRLSVQDGHADVVFPIGIFADDLNRDNHPWILLANNRPGLKLNLDGTPSTPDSLEQAEFHHSSVLAMSVNRSPLGLVGLLIWAATLGWSVLLFVRNLRKILAVNGAAGTMGTEDWKKLTTAGQSMLRRRFIVQSISIIYCLWATPYMSDYLPSGLLPWLPWIVLLLPLVAIVGIGVASSIFLPPDYTLVEGLAWLRLAMVPGTLFAWCFISCAVIFDAPARLAMASFPFAADGTLIVTLLVSLFVINFVKTRFDLVKLSSEPLKESETYADGVVRLSTERGGPPFVMRSNPLFPTVFAVQSKPEMVVVSGHFLALLSPEEKFAVLARNANDVIQRHQPRFWRAYLLFLGCFFVLTPLVTIEAPGLVPFEIPLFFIALFGVVSIAYRFERIADKEALFMTKDYDSLASGLAKFDAFNKRAMPRAAYLARIRHPRIEKRLEGLESIARKTSIPVSSSVADILKNASAEVNQYLNPDPAKVPVAPI